MAGSAIRALQRESLPGEEAVKRGIIRTTGMTIEEAILNKVRKLPPEKQRELLRLADGLSAPPQPKPPLRSPEGLWADLGVDISEDDIAEIRREMWKNFPRDDI